MTVNVANMTSIEISFPSQLLVAVSENQAQFSRRVMIYTLGHLYTQGKISSGFAAQILHCSRWQFYERLSDHGFAVIDYDEEDADYELETSQQLAQQS